MFPKKRRATFIPVQVESFPPSIPDYARVQQHLDNAHLHLWYGLSYALGVINP